MNIAGSVIAGIDQATSGAPTEATAIARMSPLTHAYLILSGTYHFARATSDDTARLS